MLMRTPCARPVVSADIVGWTSKNVNSFKDHGGPYPSWRTGSIKDDKFATKTTMQTVDQTTTLPINDGCCAGSATYVDLDSPYFMNAVTAYSLCDIARTVLQQNANQAKRASCAPTAYLSSISAGAPVYAMRLALELFWTGELSSIGVQGWANRYAMLPGLVPYVGDCAGMTKADCEAAADRPAQGVGLTWSWQSTLGQFSKGADSKDPENDAANPLLKYAHQPFHSPPAVYSLASPNNATGTHTRSWSPILTPLSKRRH